MPRRNGRRPPEVFPYRRVRRSACRVARLTTGLGVIGFVGPHRSHGRAAACLPSQGPCSLALPQGEPERRILRTSLRLVTYNALSMVEDTARGFSERPTLVRAQLQALRPTFVGIQEARRGRLCKTVGSFPVVSSQAQHNCFGCRCQLWVNADTQVLPHGKAILPKHLAVCVSDPHILTVAIGNGAFRATVIVAHAQGTQATVEVRRAWWKRLAGIIGAAKSEVILLAGANAKVGSCVSEYIGPGGFPEQQDDNGVLLHRLLAEASLFLPASFCEVDHSHATRAGHRIEYVAVPIAWRRTIVGAFACRDFDPFVRGEDRCPVVLDCETVLATGELKGTRGPAIDLAKTTDPVAVANFATRLRALPAIPWDVPVDARTETLGHRIRAAATAAFPCDREPRPFKPYISAGTFKIIGYRKMLQRNLRSARAGRCTPLRWPATQAAFCVSLDAYADVGILAFTLSSMRALTMEAAGPVPWIHAMAEHLGLTHRLLNDLIRVDRVAFLERTSDSFGPAMSAGAGKQAWRAIRVHFRAPGQVLGSGRRSPGTTGFGRSAGFGPGRHRLHHAQSFCGG